MEQMNVSKPGGSRTSSDIWYHIYVREINSELAKQCCHARTNKN